MKAHHVLVRQAGKDPGWHFEHRPLGLLTIIAYKAVWGFVEILAGIVLLFSSKLIAGELLEDPQDLLIHWLLSHVQYNQKDALYLGIVVMLLGIGKLILAVGLWNRSFLVRRFGLFFFSVLAVYGAYHLTAVRFSFFKLGALLVDLSILYYFWKVLPHHLRHGEIS